MGDRRRQDGEDRTTQTFGTGPVLSEGGGLS